MQNDFTIKIVFTRGAKQKHVEQDVGFLTLKRGLLSYKNVPSNTITRLACTNSLKKNVKVF